MSEAPMQRPLVQLPSGVCIQPDKVLFIARIELNQFAVFFENMPRAPNIDGKDLDAMKAYGLIQELTLDKNAHIEDAVVIEKA